MFSLTAIGAGYGSLLVTEETKRMVTDNICYLLNSFLRCSEYDNVVFCWVLHERGIIDGILSRLDLADVSVRTISLVCDEESLRERLQKDIDTGLREPDVIPQRKAAAAV